MPLRGNAEALSLADIIELIRSCGFSGALHVTAKGMRRDLLFRRGELSISNLGRVAYRLGDILVRGKVATREQVEAAFNEQRRSGRRLGEILISSGTASEEAIRSAVRRQLEEEIFDILLWDGAFFEYVRTDERGRPRVKETAGPPALARPPSEGDEALDGGNDSAAEDLTEDPLARFDTRSLVIEAARRSDEWHRIQQLVASPRIAFRVRQGADDLLRGALEELDVEASKIGVLTGLNDLRADDLVAKASLTQFEALTVVARLVETRQLQRLSRPAIEGGLRAAVAANDRDRSLRYFETAFESPDFPSGRRRVIAEVFLGKAKVASRREPDQLPPDVEVRTRGPRVPEMFSALMSSGHPFRMAVTDGANQLEVRRNDKTLTLLSPNAGRFSAIARELVRRDVIGRREVEMIRKQLDDGSSPAEILVGSGIVDTRDWVRGLKDRIAGIVFETHFWSAPYVEIHFGEEVASSDDVTGETVAGAARLGTGAVSVPIWNWVREEIVDDAQSWINLSRKMPKPRQLLRRTDAPAGFTVRSEDPLARFDGTRTVEEIRQAVGIPPRDFYESVAAKVVEGALAPVPPGELKDRLKRAVEARQTHEARWLAASAMEGGMELEVIMPLLAGLEGDDPGSSRGGSGRIPFDPAKSRAGSGRYRFDANASTAGSGRFTFDPEGSGAFDLGVGATSRPTMEVIEGDSMTVPIGELIQALNQRGLSGTIQVSAWGTGSCKLYLDRGELVILSSQFPALDDIRASDGSSGPIVVRESAVNEDILGPVKHELLDILSRPDARFEFHRDLLPKEFVSPDPGSRRLELRTKVLLVEIARRLAEWEELLEVIPNDQAVLVFENPDDRLVTAEALEDRDDANLLLLLDGTHSVHDVIRHSDHTALDVYRFLAMLLRAGTIMVQDLELPEERLWEQLREIIPSDDAICRFASADARMRVAMRYDDEDVEILALLHGHTPVGEIIQQSGRAPIDVYRLLGTLVRDGLLKVSMPAGELTDQEIPPGFDQSGEWSEAALGFQADWND